MIAIIIIFIIACSRLDNGHPNRFTFLFLGLVNILFDIVKETLQM